MGRVLVVGSCNVDHVIRVAELPLAGETVFGGSPQLFGGGKGANQAVAAVRDGAAVVLIGAIGDDADGRTTLDDLTTEGIDTTSLVTLPGLPTGMALIVVDARGENTIVVVSGANGAIEPRSTVDTLDRLGAAPADVCLTGFEVPTETVEAVARWVAAHRGRLIVNPAPASRVSPALLASGPILTPNAGEATALTGLSDPAAAARELSRQTGTWVVVTLGPDGALVASAQAIEHIPGRRVRAVDTTGAGDTFSGVLAAALSRGDEMPQAVRRANAAAALSVQAPGARAGMPTRAETDRQMAAP
jgi:ribokinase